MVPSYVPVMPVLPGDMEGARHVSRPAQRLTKPLFVIVKPRRRNSKPEDYFVVEAADRIVEAWKLKGVPFVELYDVPTMDRVGWWSSDHPLVLLHAYLRNRGVPSIPVTATDRKDDYHDAFITAAKMGKLGIAVRLYEDDLEAPAATIKKLVEIAKEAECANSDVDLIIDLKRILIDRFTSLRAQVLDFLSALDREVPNRSVTLVGSSLPLNLDGIPQNDDRDVHRLELRLWKEVCAARGQSHLLGLGDYLTVRPEYDDRQTNFKHINAKIFYTTNEATRVCRGQSRMKEKLEFQYPKLAARLTSSPAFRGAAFSWGDNRIASCASGAQLYGRPVDWIAFTISHHIELVSAQIEQEFTVPA